MSTGEGKPMRKWQSTPLDAELRVRDTGPYRAALPAPESIVIFMELPPGEAGA